MEEPQISMLILPVAVVGQIETAFDLAKQGATMGGQAILITFLLILGWVVKSMHNSNKEQVNRALAAHEKQHAELVSMLNGEREAGKKERESNHETLVRIATESATGLQATAAAIVGQTAALNSLRDSLHAIRGDENARSLQRQVREMNENDRK